MIFDHIRNLGRYTALPFAGEIERFIADRDCSKIPDGEIEILGRDLFVRVAEYPTGPASEKKFEAHRIYADLQFVVSGREVMGVSLETAGRVAIPYDAKADILFVEEPEVSFPVTVSAGQFTVFYPGELHKPGCLAEGISGRVKKLVFKIRMGNPG